MEEAQPQRGSVGRRKFPEKSAPKGWLSQHELMDLVEDNFPLEERKTLPGNMLLMQNASSLHVVEYGGNYYIWNELTDEVYVIVQLVALPQILKLLEEGKMPVYRHVQEVWDGKLLAVAYEVGKGLIR